MPFARDVTTIGSATLLSRLLGFVRDIGIAAVLGAGPFSDALLVVLQIVNFFRRLLAEGALNAAFVPMWLRIRAADGESGAGRFLLEVSFAMLLAVGALAAVATLLAPAAIDLLAPGFDGARRAAAANYLRIAAPYIALAGVVAVLAAALHAQGRMVAAALGTVAFNAVLLLALAWISAAGAPAPATIGAMLCHAMVLAGLVQLIVTGIGFLRLRPGWRRPRLAVSPQARRFFALAGPGLIAAGIPQLTLIAGAMIASSAPGAVSWLYYANRLYELPLGMVSIAVAAVLVPAMAASLQRGRDAMAAAQSRGLEIALGLALPAAVALAVLAAPIASVLFERGAFDARDSAAVAAALAAICAGLPGHVLEKVLGSVAFAHEDTRAPMLAALAGLAGTIAGALALAPRYGHVGVAAAIAASGWIGAVVLGATLWRRGWLELDRAAARRLPRILLATIIMGLTIFALHHLLVSRFALAAGSPARLARLALVVAIGLSTYAASLQLLGVARLRRLIGANSE
jgi:putative peptidoglycan lipid II flippase